MRRGVSFLAASAAGAAARRVASRAIDGPEATRKRMLMMMAAAGAGGAGDMRLVRIVRRAMGSAKKKDGAPPTFDLPFAVQRCGLIAVKAGMTREWDKWGREYPLTVLYLDANQVTQVRREETDGHFAVQVGAGEPKLHRVPKPQLYHCVHNGLPPSRVFQEFRVSSEDELVPLGTQMDVRHLVPGQYVDVQSDSKGKGFQGVMKRWGFKGQRETHGTSKTHRSAGSTGMATRPGRIFKGKKMAGRMGGHKVTVKSLWVYKIDYLRNLIYLKGAVPGPNGGYVRITDAKWRRAFPEAPPLPTFVAEQSDAEAVTDDAAEREKEGEQGFRTGELYAPVPDHDVLKAVIPNEEINLGRSLKNSRGAKR